MPNPLLNYTHIPPFSEIKPEHIKPAVEQACQELNKTIAAISRSQNLDWEHIVLPLEKAQARLHQVWSPIVHMNSVVSSDELRAAHELPCSLCYQKQP